MTRASDSLAPPWLPRQQRRHVDRAMRKLIRRNACSICGAPFEPNTGTTAGFDVSGGVALVGECCIGKLKQFRRVAMRYEKTARNYLAIVTFLWIR